MTATGFTADDLDGAQDKPRAKGTLPFLPREPGLLPKWLTSAFRPPRGFQFERFDRSSVRKVDACSITFRNGRERRTFRFDRQADLTSPGLRSVVVGVSAGWLQMPHLTASEIEDIWVGLCTLGRVLSEFDDREEAIKWTHQLLDQTTTLTGHTLVPDGRHDGLMAIRAQGEFVRRDAEQLNRGGEGWQRRPLRFVDKQTGEQFTRAGETATFVWHVIGVRDVTRATLRARLAEVGVEAHRFEAYQPPHPKLSMFQLTDELVEYAETISPSSTAAELASRGSS